MIMDDLQLLRNDKKNNLVILHEKKLDHGIKVFLNSYTYSIFYLKTHVRRIVFAFLVKCPLACMTIFSALCLVLE